MQEVCPKVSKTNLEKQQVKTSNRGTKSSKTNQTVKSSSEPIEVVELSDSESSVEVIKAVKEVNKTPSPNKNNSKQSKKQLESQVSPPEALKRVIEVEEKVTLNHKENQQETPKLVKSNDQPSTNPITDKEQNKENNKTNTNHLNMMRLGHKKSGRFWKSDRDRFRSVVKSKGLKQVSSQKRIAQKQELLRIKEYEKSLKEDVKKIREEKKRRTEENKKKREENEKKNEIVQVIKNTAKLKRMKKKQLRMLAKRDVTKVV